MTDPARTSFSLQAIGRSALILTVGAGAAQALGIVRELFLAAQVGVSVELDALLIALVLPTTLAGVMTSGIVTALVPAYLGLRTDDDAGPARRFAGGILVWAGLLGIGLTALLYALSGPAVLITGPGLADDARAAAVEYLRVLAPLAFVVAVSSILQAVCQAEERFGGIAAANLAAPAVTLATMFALWNSLGLTSVALGSLIGPIVGTVLLYLTTLRAAAAPRPTIRLPRAGLREFLRHAAPLTLSAAVLQLNTVADRAIASLIAPGGVSALRFAEILVRAPIGMIAPAWGNAIYPALVKATRSPDGGEVGRAVGRTIRYAIAVFVPIAALTAAVAPVAVSVAYGRGAFSAEDIALTVPIVAAFAPLVVILMVSPVLTGALNARQRGSILLVGGAMNAVLNLVLDIVLGAAFGVVGIALASSITSTVVLLYFARRLTQSEQDLGSRAVGRTLGLATLAAIPAAAVVAAIAWQDQVPSGVVPGLAALALFGLAGMAAYLVAAMSIGLEEARSLVGSVRSWAGRLRATP